MTTPFPERVRVPRGLVKRRLYWGMTTFTVAILLLLLVAPLLVFGRQAWWVVPVVLIAGGVLAEFSRQDPDFLRIWSGEMRLKKRYY